MEEVPEKEAPKQKVQSRPSRADMEALEEEMTRLRKRVSAMKRIIADLVEQVAGE